MNNFISSGKTLEAAMPATGYKAGEPVVLGTTPAIVKEVIKSDGTTRLSDEASASGDTGVFLTEGVVSLPALPADLSATAVGAKIYLKDGEKTMTTTSTSNHLFGTVAKAIAGTETLVYVKLLGGHNE